MSAVAVICVFASEPQATLWIQALLAAGHRAFRGLCPQSEQVDVILRAEDATPSFSGFPVYENRPVATIRVVDFPIPCPQWLPGTSTGGISSAPSVLTLPADVTPREITLACTLLAEIAQLQQLQEEKRARELQLTELALTDPLTGVLNRRGWELQAPQRIADYSHSLSCLLLIDLDHFKRINSEIGHSAGDACLKEVAERLSTRVRKQDLVARLGGDEFVLLLVDVDRQRASALVNRLRESIGSEPFGCLPQDTVTASAGWVLTTRTPEAASDRPPSEISSAVSRLLEAADKALRAAKTEGRNRTIAAALSPDRMPLDRP